MRQLHLLVLFAFLCNISAQARTLPPDFTANYYVNKFSVEIGRAQYVLDTKEHKTIWSSKIYLTGLAALFLNGTVLEKSEFTTGHSHSALLLNHYSYRHTNSNKNRNVTANIDWHTQDGKCHNSGLMTGNARGVDFSIALTQPVWDQNSVILALLSDIQNGKQKYTYEVFHRGEISTQTWTVEGHDKLQSGSQSIDTIKVHRRSGNRDTWLWLAKDINYVPLKILQYKDGESDMTMLLDEVQFHASDKNYKMIRETADEDDF